MDNLHLIDEDGYLIRAAMLAFYKEPEKWVTGSYIKIGYFGKSDADLEQNGYVNDINKDRLHHEIYMSDARKVALEKWKTVIRHPIKKV